MGTKGVHSVHDHACRLREIRSKLHARLHAPRHGSGTLEKPLKLRRPERHSKRPQETLDLPPQRRPLRPANGRLHSINAGATKAEVLTKPLIFAGKQLELNLSTSEVGGLRVELQTEDVKAIPGFSLKDCGPSTETASISKFNGKATPSWLPSPGAPCGCVS